MVHVIGTGILLLFSAIWVDAISESNVSVNAFQTNIVSGVVVSVDLLDCSFILETDAKQTTYVANSTTIFPTGTLLADMNKGDTVQVTYILQADSLFSAATVAHLISPAPAGTSEAAAKTEPVQNTDTKKIL